MAIQDNWSAMTPSQRELVGYLINRAQLVNVESAIKYVFEKMVVFLTHS
jgi:hypothetical protein